MNRTGMAAFLLVLPLNCALGTSNITVGSGICVTSQSSDWAVAPNNGGPCVSFGQSADPLLPATFTLPEPASETTLESIGDFTFNTPFTSPQGYYTITDNGNLNSDYILFGNTSGGDGEVFFYSEMTPRNLTGYTSLGPLCTEGTSGCSGSFTIGTASGDIAVTAASDGETRPFDPFGLGSDYSDGISFTQATPEPSQLPVALAMALGIFCARRWRKAPATAGR